MKRVLGISLVFLSLDILGGVFSILSLIFNETIDWVGIGSYATVVVCDSAIVFLWVIFESRTRASVEVVEVAHA